MQHINMAAHPIAHESIIPSFDSKAMTNAETQEKNADGMNNAGTTEYLSIGIYSDFSQKLIIAHNAIPPAKISPNQLIGFVHSTTIPPTIRNATQVSHISSFDFLRLKFFIKLNDFFIQYFYFCLRLYIIYY